MAGIETAASFSPSVSAETRLRLSQRMSVTPRQGDLLWFPSDADLLTSAVSHTSALWQLEDQRDSFVTVTLR